MLVTRLAFLFAALFLPSIAILPDVMAAPPQSPGAGQIHEIQMTAKKYEFSPDPIRVKKGERVRLVITAIDHDHGFKIGNVPDGASSNDKAGLVFASEQECWQLKKGETTMIEFVAKTPGTYSFKCCHTCGLGHKGMKGQIIVEP